MGLLQQSSPAASTPVGNQVVAGNNANQDIIASAQSSVNNGQTLTPDVVSAVSGDIASTNAASQSLQTPTGRQPYLDNTNITPVQNNYDALAKQLASYDQMVMQPQFQGTNPGAPSELNGISGYYNPNLSYNSADARTPDQTLYNANPTYGLTTQADQGNSIVGLLGTLNALLKNESARGTARYTSDLSRLTSALPQLNDILKQNTDLTMSKAQIEAENARSAASNAKDLIIAGLADPLTGKPYGSTDPNQLGASTDDPKTPQQWANAFMGGSRNWASIPTSLQIAVNKIVKDEGGDVSKINDTYNAVSSASDNLKDVKTAWEKMTTDERGKAQLPTLGLNNGRRLAVLTPNLANIDNIFYDTMVPAVKLAVGGRLTNQEIQIFHDQLPGAGDSALTAQNKLNTLQKMINQKLFNPNYTVSTADLASQAADAKGAKTTGTAGDTRVVNGTTYKKSSDGLWHKQ
jgi:hypothetical protein